MGGVVTRIVSINHLCSCLSQALYSADLLAMGLIASSWQEGSHSSLLGWEPALAEIADPYLCSWGPSTPVKGRKLCFLRVLSMAHSVATSYDADRPSPSPPTPAQERACALFALSGFQNRASFSYQQEWWQQQHSEHADKRTACCGNHTRQGTFQNDTAVLARTFLLDLWVQLWRRALATLSYLLFFGSSEPLSQSSEAGGGSSFVDLGSSEKLLCTV